jgi:hypothetical protein
VHLINWKYAGTAGSFVEAPNPIATLTDRIAKKTSRRTSMSPDDSPSDAGGGGRPENGFAKPLSPS